MNAACRQAVEADLGQVAALYRDWEAEGCTGGLVADSVEDLRRRLGPHFFVAVAADGPAGFAVAAVSTECACVFPQDVSYLVLHDLYVAASHRGQGVGSALVEAVLDSGRKRGIRRFTTYSSNRDWQSTFGFYRKFGFGMWSFAAFLDEEGENGERT